MFAVVCNSRPGGGESVVGLSVAWFRKICGSVDVIAVALSDLVLFVESSGVDVVAC